MEGTRIDSLSVKFGYPWVYQHQGSCEHILVFSDARLINILSYLGTTIFVHYTMFLIYFQAGQSERQLAHLVIPKNRPNQNATVQDLHDLRSTASPLDRDEQRQAAY